MKEKSRQPGRGEILSRLQEEIPGILKGRPVMLAYLFGSVADRTALPSSDVDIALVLEPGCNLAPYDRMKMEFDIATEVDQAQVWTQPL